MSRCETISFKVDTSFFSKRFSLFLLSSSCMKRKVINEHLYIFNRHNPPKYLSLNPVGTCTTTCNVRGVNPSLHLPSAVPCLLLHLHHFLLLFPPYPSLPLLSSYSKWASHHGMYGYKSFPSPTKEAKCCSSLLSVPPLSCPPTLFPP